MSTVLKDFVCKKTGKLYKAGSAYSGVRQEALEELGYIESSEGSETNTNTADEWPKHTGGGWYEISNGDKVQGKESAEEAQAEIDDSNE